MAKASRPIWLRLTLTYVGVALLAVLILAGITAVFSERYVNVLVSERRDDLTRALLVDAASTYNTGQPGWSDVDLRPALDLAASSGTDVAVVDNDGAVVAATFTDPRHAAGTQHEPILVRGQQVGALYVKFNGRGLVESADNLRRSLIHADVAAAGVAAVLALVAAVIVARRLSGPVRSLTAAASAMSRGNRQVRVGRLARAPAELSELATTFDHMAETISREEQLRRDLVADVAHELRTPVAVLQANSEALLDGVVPHTREQTASLHEEVLRLAGMVEDLQTLASAEAAALHLVRETCDLATVAELATDAMQARAAVAGVRLTRELAPAVIEGDPTRLHQIVTNLLSNAVKFTPADGTVEVRVNRERQRARLVVSDTGSGIGTDELPHVFDRFWRGRQAAEATEGTGIGLSIVAELVAAHDGDISVDSPPGEGTTVTVTFPLSPGVGPRFST
jgi:two-component system, OmpR family, sensor histidine kinase BaeS